MKTSAQYTALAPLMKIQQALMERAEQERFRNEVNAEVARARVDGLTTQIKQHYNGAKKGKTDTPGRSLEELKDELAHAKEELERYEQRPPTLILGDVTPERLLEAVMENPRGVSLVTDEAYGFILTLQKKGREDMRTMILTGHEGDIPYDSGRSTRKRDRYVPELTLCVLGTIQPSRLRALQAGAIEGDDADGFLQRFQITTWPERPEAYDLVDREGDKGVTNKMALPVANRFTHIEVIPDVEQWSVDYAPKVGLDPKAVAFFRWKPELFNTFDPTNPELGKAFATPRTVERAIRMWMDDRVPMHIREAQMAGTIGSGVAAEFLGFMELFERVTPIKEIERDPKNARVPSPDELSLVYATVAAVSGAMKESNVDALTTYLERFDEDMVVLGWLMAVQRDESLFGTDAFSRVAQNYRKIFQIARN